ncbi:MAG: apurinic/apyrimidinic endonuclease family protein [Armatimonadota bacterium]
MRVGFSCRATKKELKNPRPDGRGEYERVIDVILACEDWGLHYYNMPPEVVGWGDYSQYKPGVAEMEEKFADLLERIREIAGITDVMLSMHAAAYNVPTSDDPVILERSIREITVERRALEMCGGKILYIHPGYGGDNPATVLDKLIERLSRLPPSRTALGIEVDEVGIGDLETVIYLAARVPGAVPVPDFGHLYGRGFRLETEDDFLSVLNRVSPMFDGPIFTHFSAVSGRTHIPLAGNMPDYRLLARAAALFEWESGRELVVLVESPEREQDAMLLWREFESAAREVAA